MVRVMSLVGGIGENIQLNLHKVAILGVVLSGRSVITAYSLAARGQQY